MFQKFHVLPDGDSRIKGPERVGALGQVHKIELLLPDVDETKLVSSIVVIRAFEEGPIDVGIRLEADQGSTSRPATPDNDCC